MLCALPPWSLRMETQTSLIVWLSGQHPPTWMNERPAPCVKLLKWVFFPASLWGYPPTLQGNPTHCCSPVDYMFYPQVTQLLLKYNIFIFIHSRCKWVWPLQPKDTCIFLHSYISHQKNALTFILVLKSFISHCSCIFFGLNKFNRKCVKVAKNC